MLIVLQAKADSWTLILSLYEIEEIEEEILRRNS
jgi:hypothetical protein